jgi:hypothetical protein
VKCSYIAGDKFDGTPSTPSMCKHLVMSPPTVSVEITDFHPPATPSINWGELF